MGKAQAEEKVNKTRLSGLEDEVLRFQMEQLQEIRQTLTPRSKGADAEAKAPNRLTQSKDTVFRVPTQLSAKSMVLELCWTLEGHRDEVSWIHLCDDRTRMLSCDLSGNVWQWLTPS